METNRKQDTILKVFAKYAALNILGMLGLSCYILADTLFIANGVGSSGLTALNLVLPVYSFISGIGLMLGMGGGTRYSILRGERKEKEACRVFTMTLAAGILAGLMITAAGLIFSSRLVVLLGADSGVEPLAGTYLKTILLFSCAFLLNNILICFIRNDGNPKLSMIAMLAGSFSNVILDYIFIFPCRMGMFGAAFATGLAPVISMGILSVHWLTGKRNHGLSICKGIPVRYGRIIMIGLPSFITEFSSGVIMLMFNITILKLAGNTGVAAYGIVANLALIVVAVYTGAAQGMQPVISANYGSGNLVNVRQTYRAAVFLSAALGVLFVLAGTIFAGPLAGIFNKEQDRTLELLAVQGIRYYFPAFLIMGVNIITAAYFAASDRAVPSFWISVLRGILAAAVFIIILPPALGMSGVWLVIPCAEAVTLAAGMLLYKRYHA